MSYMLPCLDGYTFFGNQFYQLDRNLVTLFNATYPHECRNYCIESSDCYGFNYDGMHLQCFLLNTDTFSPLNLQQQQDNYIVGFYMNSYENCSFFNQNTMLPLFIALAVFIVLLMPVCFLCGNRRQRIHYLSRTSSRTSLIERQVPPPYRENTESNQGN